MDIIKTFESASELCLVALLLCIVTTSVLSIQIALLSPILFFHVIYLNIVR